MRLELHSITVDCIIGDLPEEREREQRLTVDVSLEVPDLAGRTDALADTVDYAALTAKIRRTLLEAKCHLIERAAYLVTEVCARERGVLAAEARVVKAGSVEHLGAASAVFCYTAS